MMSRVKIIIGCILVLAVNAFSQKVEEPGVRVQGRATQRSIKLRWAPNSPTLWHFANKYGYTIERTLVSENNKILSSPVRTILNPAPLKPAAQQAWEGPMDSDDYVAVAAQAIFGETFELTNNYSNDVITVINKAKELESRFSYALFSADQSIKAAELSGLYYEDETVAPNAKYLYRIFANVPVAMHAADTGYVFLGLPDYQPLPPPFDLRAEFQDNLVLLSWNGELFSKIYNSYWVERSQDAKTFKRITEQPIVNSFAGDAPKTELIFKTDSLPSNDVRYYYRVLGINAFGETGPPSDTISGAGRSLFAYSAAIGDHLISKEGKVTLNWTFPVEGLGLLQSFDLTRVDIKTKITTTILKGLPKTARTIQDDSPKSSNYYVIRAVDKYGRTNNSFPYLVQLEDSIPPKPPVELTGRIDTMGHVFLQWEGNEEEDLLGYTIYKANFQSDEFIQIPGEIRAETAYVDTIKLKNLTENIYYKISAMDKRFNQSKFSEVLVLKKPDKIPPVSAVFQSIKCDSIGIFLQWERSSSHDVVQHLLYRKSENDLDWVLVKMIEPNDTLGYFLDMDVKHRVQYSYTILAVDDDGLESPPASPLAIRFILLTPYKQVDEIFHKLNKEKRTITLQWKYEGKEIEKFLIYKSTQNQPFKMFTSVDGTQREWNDKYPANEGIVQYRIAVMFKTGEKTKPSAPLQIKI